MFFVGKGVTVGLCFWMWEDSFFWCCRICDFCCVFWCEGYVREGLCCFGEGRWSSGLTVGIGVCCCCSSRWFGDVEIRVVNESAW